MIGGGRFCRGRRPDFLATPQTCLNAGFAGPLRLRPADAGHSRPAASGRLRRNKNSQKSSLRKNFQLFHLWVAFLTVYFTCTVEGFLRGQKSAKNPIFRKSIFSAEGVGSSIWYWK